MTWFRFVYETLDEFYSNPAKLDGPGFVRLQAEFLDLLSCLNTTRAARSLLKLKLKHEA